MLSTPEIQRLLSKVSYKPGWKFEAYDGAHEFQHVVIWTVVQDAYDLDKTVALDVHSFLPPQRDEECFWSWLLWRLKRLEVHECREFLRIDGTIYSDPHAEGADQDRQ